MKKILRYLILGGTIFFLGKTIKDHWLEVSTISIDAAGVALLVTATGVTLLAHIWAGWIWTWVLQELKQSISPPLFIQVYLKTNIAKYIPGNVWHYYGRIMAAKNASISMGAATLSVLLEPLLMAIAALIFIDLFASQIVIPNSSFILRIFQFLGLAVILSIIHPRFLNPIIGFVYKIKEKTAKKSTPEIPSNIRLSIDRYPLRPLLGELIFLGLRGTGFILAFSALNSVTISQIPLLLGAFSFAWLLGLIVPGAPGGLGVFEASAIAILQYHFSPVLVISAIALYRLISIIAETAGAALAWVDERLTNL